MSIDASRMRKRKLNTDDSEDAQTANDPEKTIVQLGNRVYFHAPVTRDSVLVLIKRIHEAEVAAMGSSDPAVLLFIHSEGGDAHAGLSAMNHIQNARLPITTIADGFTASAATFMLLGGKRRLAMPNSTVLIHQLSTAFWGKYADLIDEMHNSKQLMRTLNALYKQHTKLTKQRLRVLLKKELNLTAAECVREGIVEGIFKCERH